MSVGPVSSFTPVIPSHPTFSVNGKEYTSADECLEAGLTTNDLDLVQKACDAGADFTARRKNLNGTPLQYASKNGSNALVEELLNRGVDPNTGHRGHTPLVLTVEYNRYDCALALIKKNADVNQSSDVDGAIPLDFASESSSVTQLLIQSKADLNKTISLHHAIGNPSSVALLINANADIEQISDGFEPSTRPLHRAAEMDDDVSLKLLLQAKADPFAQTDRGETPLDYAIQKKNAHIKYAPELGLKKEVLAKMLENCDRIIKILIKSTQKKEEQDKLSKDVEEEIPSLISSFPSLSQASSSSSSSSSSFASTMAF